jgi:hypothetical protein
LEGERYRSSVASIGRRLHEPGRTSETGTLCAILVGALHRRLPNQRRISAAATFVVSRVLPNVDSFGHHSDVHVGRRAGTDRAMGDVPLRLGEAGREEGECFT